MATVKTTMIDYAPRNIQVHTSHVRLMLIAGAFLIGGAGVPHQTLADDEKKPSANLGKPSAASQPTGGQPAAPHLVPSRKRSVVVPEPTVILKTGEVPMIEFELPTFDFGTLSAGTQVEHEFWFKNAGTGPLEILLVKPGCGCTTAGEFEHIVQPGELGRIPVNLDTTKFSGQISKPVTVFSNSPGVQRQVDLALTGQVNPLVVLTPKKLEFGSFPIRDVIGKALSKSLMIESRGEEPLILGKIHTSNPVFKARVETLDDGRLYRLHVKLGEPLRTGSNASNIEIETNIAAIGTLRIPAGIFLRSPVETMPSQLVISDSRKIPTTMGVSVMNNGPTGIRVGGMQLSNPMLKAVIEEITPGFAWKIRVDIPQEYHPPITGDTLSIRTSHPEIPELVVDIVERSMLRPGRPRPGPKVETFEGAKDAKSSNGNPVSADKSPNSSKTEGQ